MCLGLVMLTIPGFGSRRFGAGCEISVILREKTSWLSIATIREKMSAPQVLSPNSFNSRSMCLSLEVVYRRFCSQTGDQDDPYCDGDDQDPVATGLIDSLARPGGNLTGVTTLQRELSGKRLEILKEAAPRISRVAALVNEIQLGERPGDINDFQHYEAPARAIKLQLQPLAVRGPNPDFEGAFRAAANGRASALITVRGSLLAPHTKRIADLALKNRLPSMHEGSDYVEAGGLMSYTSDEAANYRRVAYYVDRILKGTKPADLPVEQPMKFEFVINLKTAKQIGLTIPPEVLARASKIIR